MTEVEFTRRDVEEPLYLDSARSRAPNPRPAERVWDPATGADPPLHLDFAREPRPRRRGVPLVLACALTFLLGAGAGVLYLQPPAVLRDTVAKVLARTDGAKTAIGAAPQAAPPGTEPAPEQAAIAASQLEAAPAPESPPARSAVPDSPPASEPVAKPPAKRQVAVKRPATASKPPPPRRAAAPKKHPADAGAARVHSKAPAQVHSKAKAPLDLDALAKSLQ